MYNSLLAPNLFDCRQDVRARGGVGERLTQSYCNKYAYAAAGEVVGGPTKEKVQRPKGPKTEGRDTSRRLDVRSSKEEK